MLVKEKIGFELKDGSINFISDVFYIPSLYQNLLNVGQLAQEGYDLYFKARTCMISDEQKDLQ